MSDPFERLRNPDTSSIVPDVAALKSRARRIERRRQMVLGAGAMAVAIVAVVGIALSGGDEPTQLAEERLEESTSTPEAALDYAAGGEVAPTPTVQEQRAATTNTGGASAARTQPESDPGAASVAAPETSPALEATIDVREPTLTHPTQFKLTVCNTSPEVVKRTFGSSQRYDFEVRQSGKLVWRWSQGRMFTQVVGEETWKLNECKTWTEEWNGMTSAGPSAAPGDYQAVGILKTSPELKTKAKTFCYASC